MRDNNKFIPENVFIERDVLELSKTKEILNNIPGAEIHLIDSFNELLNNKCSKETTNTLIIAKQRGKFFKPCPCTAKHVCCGYYFLNLSTNCNIGCSYCIMQDYLNNPYLTVYSNMDDLFGELNSFLDSAPGFYRIGTGELTDSLLLDHITGYSHDLIEYFNKRKNAVLELKTKTTNIDRVLQEVHSGNTMISWSLNPQNIITNEEKYSAGIDDRILSAKKCAEKGYIVGFHFDPILFYNNWEEDYKIVIKKISEHIKPKDIGWISLGCLRYSPNMDKIVRNNHPKSNIYLGEMISGTDGKLRYFRTVRQKIYKEMLNLIKTFLPETYIYLCMESKEVWNEVFGEDFLNTVSVPQYLTSIPQIKSKINEHSNKN